MNQTFLHEGSLEITLTFPLRFQMNFKLASTYSTEETLLLKGYPNYKFNNIINLLEPKAVLQRRA